MSDYTDLRAALAQTCHALLIDDPDTIRALLTERDGLKHDVEQYVGIASEQATEISMLRDALQGLLDALPSATTHPAIQAARAALAQGEA